MGTVKTVLGNKHFSPETVSDQSWPLVKSNVSIPALTPVKVIAWDTTRDCPIIYPMENQDDNYVGITKDVVNGYAEDAVIYEGILENIDTSALDELSKIFPTTEGDLTTSWAETLIPLCLGICVRQHATEGKIYLNAISYGISQFANISKLIASNATSGSGDAGQSVEVRAGSGDGAGDGGDLLLKPGEGGVSGNDGSVIIPQAGTEKSDNKFVRVYFDGADGVIEPSSGDLKTNDHTLDAGTGDIKGKDYHMNGVMYLNGNIYVINKALEAFLSFLSRDTSGDEVVLNLSNVGSIGAKSLNLSTLDASKIVETDGSKNLITAAKNNGYNKALTVAVVNPTAPNRTIKINVDGTDYYIHAKTTND